MWIRDDVCFDRVRIASASESADSGAPAIRLRLAQLLSQADVHPSGLVPRAILLVRSLRDPLPQRLNLAGGPVTVDRSWERAAREALSVRAARAVRPIRGRIVGEPEAILFQDEAELLACLAIAFQNGGAATRWWWQLLLRRNSALSTTSWSSIWCERGAAAPAAVRHLVDWNQTSNTLGAMSAGEATKLLTAVGQAWGLSGLADREPEAARTAPARHGNPERTNDNDPPQPARPELTGTRTEKEFPIAPFVAAAVMRSGLARFEHRRLLAVTLILATQPFHARTRGFSSMVARWCRDGGPSHQIEQRPGQPPGPGSFVRPKPVAAAADPIECDWTATSPSPRTAMPERGPELPIPMTLSESPYGGSQEVGQPESLPGSRHSEDHVRPRLPDASGASPASAQAASAQANGREPATMAPDNPSRPSTAVVPPCRPPADSVPGPIREGIASAFGGAFYLIHVIERYPPCFQSEGTGVDSLAIDRWEWLAALARGLLGRAGWTDWRDPLWECLIELAHGEPNQPLGLHWPSANPDLLRRRWTGEDCGHDPMETIPLSELCACGLAPRGASWLAPLLPFLELRLAQVLECPPKAVAATLLMSRAHVYVTATHVDVVFLLDAISIPVRRAGLDCDPGWLPPWGRVIQFHFD